MPGFFLKGKGPEKRKRTVADRKKKKPTTKPKETGEIIDSDSDIASDDAKVEKGNESDSSIDETAEEKRVRLAKEYIAKLEEEERLKSCQNEVDRDAIANRLREDMLEERGVLQKTIADNFASADTDNIRILKGHQLSVTCLAISHDDKNIFSGSKDGSIIKWSVSSGMKEHKIAGLRKADSKSSKGHRGCVSCLAVSSDGRFLASGGQENMVHIWNAEDMSFIRSFTGHKASITALAFRRGANELFTASKDRSIKVWNLEEMTYIETLFGHEDTVTGIDSFNRDRAVTSGGRDRTVRLWKIPEESQLVFRAHGSSSIDCVSMINEEHSVSGADDGSLSVWNVHKKRPLVTIRNAHKVTVDDSQVDGTSCKESWVTAVAAVKNCDLVASGSCDSCIRLWKCQSHYRALRPLFTIPLTGFVNTIAFSQNGDFLVAGTGQEHRLGRWWRMKNAKNNLYIIPLLRKDNDK